MFQKDDREAACSRFASANELHISHDQQRYNRVYSCVSPLGMYYTRNTMMRSTNVLVDSCDMKVDFGALGSVSAKEALECKAPMLSDLQSWTHWNHLPKDGKIIRINHSASVDKFLDALLKGSSIQTTIKLLSLFASYGGKQHVPLSLLEFHAQRAMEVILKSSVDRAAVQSSCDELDGETTVCLPAIMHIKQKECRTTASTVKYLAVARDRIKDPVECTDKNSDLVMHRDKDIDMFRLDWDFNVHIWAYGQPGDRWCVSFLGDLGGAQPVTEEPSLSRRSPALQSKMGVWPWASMALGGLTRPALTLRDLLGGPRGLMPGGAQFVWNWGRRNRHFYNGGCRAVYQQAGQGEDRRLSLSLRRVTSSIVGLLLVF
ncbi:hypothetical protein Syun_025310 [Stephania yunnanensis]|uniref:Uncharacterized protein n=1 Tax=Stephania yunnanensis TaxID=152371 RepID=A0AAP0HW41_9MAGN